MNENVQEWKEKRMGWMNDRVVENIERKRSANRNYRRTRKSVGVNDHRAKEAKEVYERCKEEAKIGVQDTLHVHNKRVMREISEAGNKKGLYKHLNGLIHKGKVCVPKKNCVLKEQGVLVDDDETVKREIENFWSVLFATTSEARLNVEKEKIQNGMMYGGGEISNVGLNGAIVKLKRDKATDDSGMIAEYLKALSETDREKLRMGWNDVVNGGSIPKE